MGGTNPFSRRAARIAAWLAFACAVSGTVAVIHSGAQGADGPFTVQQVSAGLARDRARWAGRVVLVRGAAATCMIGFCPNIATDLPPLAGMYPLSYEPGFFQVALGVAGDDSWLSPFRTWPLIDRFVPRSAYKAVFPHSQGGVVSRDGTFRVRILDHPRCSKAIAYDCYDGLLLGLVR